MTPADVMQIEDEASRELGIKLEALRPGYARMSMKVTKSMSNGQKVCHGRRGVYDVRVVNQKGETIALFRGQSATIKGTWVE